MKVGVIGGSGLYNIEGIDFIDERTVETPFGKTSDNIIYGKAGANEVFFMARHGRNHSLLPHELNHHANIWAMKSLGVETILSLSAVGSLREDYKPLDFVLVDQYVDNSRRQGHSFFGQGAVAHVSMASPACETVSRFVFEKASKSLKNVIIHPAGTYLNMEGPGFSTKAESKMYRQLEMDIIGMTNFLEAKLAREAEICYLTIAMVTDFDCWHPKHADVTVEQVMSNLNENSSKARELLKIILPALKSDCHMGCRHSLKQGLMTPVEAIPADTFKKLKPILEKYQNQAEQ